MRTNLVVLPPIKDLIRSSKGFKKKALSDYKLDLMALCEFGCRYCSSNTGAYLRVNRERFAKATEEQLGRRYLPGDHPELAFAWDGVIDRLREQLKARRGRNWGRGKTLVFSMLTDGFSPYLANSGKTEEALRLVLDHTQFRIRVLTKNSVVGRADWVNFFAAHPGRFVVGLSTGTLDGEWARKVELRTPSPASRLKALHSLQVAGVPTYGMLCPVFPDVLEGDGVERLVAQIRPDFVETVWAEPFNDRKNWEHVRDGYDPASAGYRWLTEVYEHGRGELWSSYATELYVRLREKARAEGWLHKLRYLLYEDGIRPDDAVKFRGLDGVLLQSEPGEDGRSRNSGIAALQASE